MTGAMRAAVYDMDLTITATPTYTRWLVFWAWSRTPWRLALLPVAGLAGIGGWLGLVSRRRVKEIAQGLMMGAGVARADVAATAQAFAGRVKLRPGALVQLAADAGEGLDLVLATASFEFYVQALAGQLGFGTVVATGSQWDDDTLRPRLAGANCYGAAKAVMVAAALPGATIVRAYSDHVSDAPLFALAAEAVAVNPSRGLQVLAARRGWRIVDWR